MKTEISIAVITKQREKELEKCLDSIKNQTNSNYKIIIIDNDPDLSAKNVIKKKKYSKIDCAYYYCSGTVPKCRNFAMQVTNTKYLGFVDDDCVLDKNWLEEGKKKITTSHKTYVLGKTKLLNPQNIFALGQYSRDDYWKDYNSQIFDTKNVIIDLELIKKKNLKFDENCQNNAYDSADFDFDFQLKKNKLKGVFCQNMLLYHKETENFKRFKKRAYFRGYLAKYINDKWHLNNKLVDLRTNNFYFWLIKSIKDFPEDFEKYSKHMSAPLHKKFLATFVIKLFERYYVIGYDAN